MAFLALRMGYDYSHTATIAASYNVHRTIKSSPDNNTYGVNAMRRLN